MLSLKESLKILKETNALIEGHFILSSGLRSSKYVQCAQLMSKPYQARMFCESLAEKINNEFLDFDLILSPAMGGIIIGYEIGKLLKKETIFSERVDCEFKLRRNFKINKNSKVLIIEANGPPSYLFLDKRSSSIAKTISPSFKRHAPPLCPRVIAKI